MRCPEFRDVMRSFLDGEVEKATRREVGLHLAECDECARLIEGDRFWDESIRSYLDRELPEGLRESILGDLVHTEAGAAVDGRGAGLDGLSWRKQLRIAWWAVKRDLSKPREMFQAVGLATVLVLAVLYLPDFLSSDESAEGRNAFGHSGPIVQAGEKEDWKPGETVPTTRLTLSGRLI